MKNPLVSIIIIDYKKDNPYLLECLNGIGKQLYTNYEIILLTDYKTDIVFPKLTKKSYGVYTGPAKKRDDGAKIARGSILSFIDDDAYPSPEWLTEIVKEFSDPQIVAVGGPGVTPPNTPWTEEASGWASASLLGSGKYLYRFLPQKKQQVDDYPSMNLAVLRDDFLKVGGFDSNFWPGEDTKLCLDLVTKTNKKIIYNPKAIVYHHRRPILIPHLKQNGNFGIHRGFFARVLPQTSFRLIYFIPSLLFLLLLTTPLVVVMAKQFILFITIQYLYLVLIFSYFGLLLLNAVWILSHSKKVFQAIVSLPVILVTHLWYGYRFLQGFLFTDKLTK